MALVPIGDVDTVWATVNATRPTYTRFLAPVEDNVDAGENNVRSILRPPRGRGSRGGRGARGCRGRTVTIPANEYENVVVEQQDIIFDYSSNSVFTYFNL
jgi:hypothetical protein